jgi:BlaI family penicillinase repressor
MIAEENHMPSPLDNCLNPTTIKPELKNQISAGGCEVLIAFRGRLSKGSDMARPPARELTERELEIMHVFWQRGAGTVAEVRDALALAGLDRAYTTVATLVRILADKGFLDQTNQERPFSYQPRRTYQEVSKKMLGELIDRVFHGSREQLLLRLLEHKSLTSAERALLEDILRQKEKRR